MAFGVCGLSGFCLAAEPMAPPIPGGVPEILASVTVLSESAMAKEAAAGVQSAPILGDQTGHARVMLWDELKAPPELPPGTSNAVTLTTGAGK
jgi:hypothetical protein